jgi:hypothetical protein
MRLFWTFSSMYNEEKQIAKPQFPIYSEDDVQYRQFTAGYANPGSQVQIP